MGLTDMPRTGRHYLVDLQKLHACCSSNYLRLLRLLNGLDGEQTLAFAHAADSAFRLQVVEEARYTTTLDIEQAGVHLPQTMLPKMRVRMYHDARMAEVLRSQQISDIKPVYHYPNQHMHQRDEKWQVNQFLAEWLQHCLDKGMRAAAVC